MLNSACAHRHTAYDPIGFPSKDQPRLIVVIDTEEDFDWDSPPDRNRVDVSSMEHVYRVQDIFDEFAIVPCYVVDYPIVSQEAGYRLLQQYHREGRCEIGTHLHPWVTPPYDEVLTRSNMYPGNLSRDLESLKIQSITTRIAEVFGEPPISYKAGRYGFGPNTADILAEQGYRIDLSHCPPVDCRQDGGPDYSRCHAEPGWIGKNNDLLEIPVTGAFTGFARGLAPTLYTAANRLRAVKVPAIFSRLSILDRLILSPEGFHSGEHKKLTRALYNQGVRTFTWSFHSSSVAPGLAPYVKTTEDLEAFLHLFRQFFDFFFNELNGVATTPTGLLAQLEAGK